MTDKEKLEKLKKLADAMYYAAQYLTTDASRLRKTMEEYHQFIINEYHKEEPVSEDLEKVAINYMKTENPPIWGLHDGFIAGANWQKQQMMKDAYDAYVSHIRDNSEAVVFLNNTSITMPSHFPKRDLDEGDKLKVITIKED